MPEEFEAETQDLQDEQTPETVEAEPETPPETTPEARHVPFERFQEVYDELKSSRQSQQQMQFQIMQMQRDLLQATTKPKAPEPQLDPEADEVLAPYIQKRLAPYEQTLAQMQKREAAMWAETEARNAWEYVKTAVPDLDDLATEMQSYLATLPQARANKITSDPDLVIQTAELVRAMKSAGKAVGTQVARQDLKQRTKSDAGTASPAPSTSKIDWSNLSDQEFAAMEAKIEAQRRRGR